MATKHSKKVCNKEVCKVNNNDLKLLRFLRDSPEGLRVKTLLKLTNLKQRVVYKRLNILKEKKLIENIYPLWKINPNYSKEKKLELFNIGRTESLLFSKKFDSIKVLEHRIHKKEENTPSKRCYFCGFSEIIEYHHIISRKIKGTLNIKDNLLVLCPNHHYLIHRTDYRLVFSNGFFYLLSKSKGKVLSPTKREMKIPRKCPFGVPIIKITPTKEVKK